MRQGWVYHEPEGNPCKRCGRARARHRVRHELGCTCGASHKGKRSPAELKPKKRWKRPPIQRFCVGLDGEGIGRAPHRYTLLAWSDSTGEQSAYIESLRGLSSEMCLSFICDIPPAARVFGYYLGYDWTKILADLPNRKLFRLYRPELRKRPGDEGAGFSPVRWKGYELNWLGGMMKVRRRGQKKWTTVWDVGKFYQCKFPDALSDAGIGTKAELDRMREMKARRSSFDDSDSEEVRGYCLDECAKLASLVEQLNDAHEQAELPLKSWYGPGSAASVLLDRADIRDKRGELPPEMKTPVACAFFGGRFEHATLGLVDGPIYSADIVSAYPAECVELPCLEHARWKWVTRERDLDDAEQACVHWELAPTRNRRAWGPLPVRQKDGTIVYPRTGASGWAWLKEYRVARRWSQVRFLAAWKLERDCDCVPFALVGEAFETRLRLGKKTAVGGALKRSINSAYGKLAQAIGNPPFRSQPWAGMITSGCRAKLLDVLWRYDDAVLAVATDGVYATAPFDVDEGAQLGQWETDEYDRIVLVRPGIYWTESDVRSRGLPRTTIAAEQDAILHALESGFESCVLPPIIQFGGARAAIYQTPKGAIRRSERYGEWYERPAYVSFAPGPKRRADWGLWELDGVESLPYSPHRLSDESAALKEAELLAVCG